MKSKEELLVEKQHFKANVEDALQKIGGKIEGLATKMQGSNEKAYEKTSGMINNVEQARQILDELTSTFQIINQNATQKNLAKTQEAWREGKPEELEIKKGIEKYEQVRDLKNPNKKS